MVWFKTKDQTFVEDHLHIWSATKEKAVLRYFSVDHFRI